MSLNSIQATYRVVTPMFLGGANPEQAEFRLPSFKGMLRFWWRALAWSRYDGDLDEIHEKEAELFGSADSNIGQAQFTMKVRRENPELLSAGRELKYEEGASQGQTVESGVCYLGYGVLDYKGRLERGCIQSGLEFSVTVLPKPGIDTDLKKSLVDALQAVGVFGGLGSRVRRGFGSLTLVECEGVSTTGSLDSLTDSFRSVSGDQNLESIPSGLPEYTAFSGDSKVFGLVGEREMSPLEFLQLLGNGMREVRAEYSGGDADMMRPVANRGARAENAPRRAVFGLPHNYFFKETGSTAGVTPVDHERRASPLWIKLHELQNGRPVALLQYLPAEFVSENRLQVGPHAVDVQFDDTFWGPIVSYVNRFLEEGSCIEYVTEPFYCAIFE